MGGGIQFRLAIYDGKIGIVPLSIRRANRPQSPQLSKPASALIENWPAGSVSAMGIFR